MRSKSFFWVGLILAVACKDGGGIVVTPQNKPLGWSFNQALAAMTFSSSGTSNFSQDSGKKFSFTTGTNTFVISSSAPSCVPIMSSIQIDNVPIDFGSAFCGVGLVRYFIGDLLVETKEFYYIAIRRSYGNKFEFLSFGFEGKDPKTASYSFSSGGNNFFSGYSSTETNLDGSIKSYTYYSPVSGTIATNATGGFRVTSDNVLMYNVDNDGVIKSFKISMGCCSN